MTIIRTHDGLIGVIIGGKTIWCDDIDHCVRVMFSVFGKFPHITKADLYSNLGSAFDAMIKHHHDTARFGMLGGFMYTEVSE